MRGIFYLEKTILIYHVQIFFSHLNPDPNRTQKKYSRKTVTRSRIL